MSRQKNLITRLQGNALGDDIHRARRVFYESKIAHFCIELFRNQASHMIEEGSFPLQEELGWVPLHFPLPFMKCLDDRIWCCAEGGMIEIVSVWAEGPLISRFWQHLPNISNRQFRRSFTHGSIVSQVSRNGQLES